MLVERIEPTCVLYNGLIWLVGGRKEPRVESLNPETYEQKFFTKLAPISDTYLMFVEANHLLLLTDRAVVIMGSDGWTKVSEINMGRNTPNFY